MIFRVYLTCNDKKERCKFQMHASLFSKVVLGEQSIRIFEKCNADPYNKPQAWMHCCIVNFLLYWPLGSIPCFSADP